VLVHRRRPDRPQFATVTLVYPLTVENSGGTWMVAASTWHPHR